MAGQWHYQHDGQNHGPATGAELKELAAAGKLLPTDLIWKEGMDKWVPARSVKGLFPSGVAATTKPGPATPTPAKPAPAKAVRSVPPPLPPSLPDDDEGDDESRRHAETRPSRRTLLIAGGSVVGLVAVTLAGLMLFGGRGGSESSTNPNSSGKAHRPDPRFGDVAKADPIPNFQAGPGGEQMSIKEWENNGYKIKAQGFVRGGKFVQHGLMTVWYPTGEKSKEEYWQDGKRHGPMVGWYKNGQKEVEGTNRDGFGDGYSVGWYEEGGKKFERMFKNRRVDGLHITYYRNSNVMRESEYETREHIGVRIKSEKWFTATGSNADGPTIAALTRSDFLEILSWRLESMNDPGGNVCYGKFFKKSLLDDDSHFEAAVNFKFDYYMRFIGKPDSGYVSDFVNKAKQHWTYACLDGNLHLRVYCGRPVADANGIIPGKAEAVIINQIDQ